MQRDDGSSVMTVTNLTEFFRDALQSALAGQRTTVDPQAERYVVNLLTEDNLPSYHRAISDTVVDLNATSKLIASGRVSFGSAERLISV